ncbi:MAG: exopolysaccharide transport family protein [Pseudomonadota bacterium]
MSGQEILTQDNDINVAGAFAALKKRWWLVALVAIITAVGMLFVLSSFDSEYKSNVRILVKDGNSAFTRTTTDTNTQSFNNQLDEQAIRSEVEIVGSNKLALQVIEELDLINNEEFNDDANSSGFLDLVFSLFGFEEKSVGDLQNEVLAEFKDRLTVYAVEQSRVIVAEFWAHDPDLAEQIVASLSGNYIEFKDSARQSSQETATSWLDPRIEELERTVSEKEAAVADFRASEDLLRSNDNDSLLATQQLSQISTELSRLKAQRSSAQAKVAAVRNALQSGSSLEVIPEVVESNLIQRLREREVGLQAQVSELSVTLLPNHPRLKSLNSQLDNLRQQIRTAAANIINSLEGNVASIQEAEAEMAREIVRLKAEAARVDEKLVELRAKEREAETARDLLAEYKSRSLEAKSRAGLSQTDAEIISPATRPINPYFPKVVPFTAAGTVAAALLTALAILAGSLLTTNSTYAANPAPVEPQVYAHADAVSQTDIYRQDNSINPSAPVEPVVEETAQPVEETVIVADRDPVVAQPAKAPVYEDVQMASEAIAVRFVATALSDLQSARIAVISPIGESGSKTTWLLARHLSAKNHSAVVIEFGEDGAVSSEMLGGNDFPGIFNLISGSVTAERIIFKDLRSNAHVVPSGTLFPDQPLPEPEAISELVGAIAEAYDFCIIDCGDVDSGEAQIVSDDQTVAIISCVTGSNAKCDELEKSLLSAGFSDVLQVVPDDHDELVSDLELT